MGITNTIIEAHNLSYRYQQDRELHFGGSFALVPGTRTVLLGANGSGKTTFLYLLLGILKPSAGEVRVFQQQPSLNSVVQKRMGVVLQRPEDQLVAETVLGDVALGLIAQGVGRANAFEQAEQLLSRLDLAHLASRKPRALSGGEQRKVALAGALIHEPEIIILDEPFAGLDPVSREELAISLIEVNEQMGVTLLFTAHELDMVLKVAEQAYLFADSRLHGPAPVEQVLSWEQLLHEARLVAPELLSLKRFLEGQGWSLGKEISWPAMAAHLLANMARVR